MFAAGHLCGGGSVLKRYKIAVTIADAGIPIISVTDPIGVRPATTTSFAACHGLGLDTDIYAATQAAQVTDGEGLITVSVRPDLIVKALASGGPTENTTLAVMSNTAASTDGLTVTATNVNDGDLTGGTVWCISGANVGQSRHIASDTASTSIVVTVAFANDIAVGDTFLEVPWSNVGTGGADIDGNADLQTSTLFTQADAEIASGTGGDVSVVDLELNGASDTYVLFTFDNHVYGNTTL